jgi:hypothetical protein
MLPVTKLDVPTLRGRCQSAPALGVAQVPGYARLHGRTMTKALVLDLRKLQARAFDRAEWAEAVLRRYHAATPKLDAGAVEPLRALYNWMFVPPTLWPFNIQDVLAHCLAAMERGRRLNSRHRLLIDLLPEPPDETICAAVAITNSASRKAPTKTGDHTSGTKAATPNSPPQLVRSHRWEPDRSPPG